MCVCFSWLLNAVLMSAGLHLFVFVHACIHLQSLVDGDGVYLCACEYHRDGGWTDGDLGSAPQPRPA